MQILIVDDDKTNIIVLSSMLKREGYNVLEARNGLEAIHCFEENNIDMILMDIMMPEMDGYQAAKEIKDRTGDKFVPIIFLTAITDENALAKCVENGGDDFLTKPYNRIILRSKIDALKRIKELYSTLHKQRNELKELNEKIEHDVELANHVYQSLVKTNTLPKEIFKTWIAPVSTFNGDVALVMQTQTGGYHIMLGDFTGHGMAAALGTIPVCDLFQDMTQRGYKILDIIIEINQKLKHLLPTGYFCAAAFISIDNLGNAINIFNAGMPKVMIKNNGQINYVHSKHLPLGIVDIDPREVVFDYVECDSKTSLCIYSDGLIECKNESSELYGYSRLENILRKNDDFIEAIKVDISQFTDLTKQEDDISVVEVNLPLKVENIPPPVRRQYTWSLSYEFDAHTLKSSDPVIIVIEAILSNNIPKSHKDRIYTIITELFNNSLEHGILGLESNTKSTPEGFSKYYELRQQRLQNLVSGEISINVKNQKLDSGGRLSFEIQDTGNGFDFEKIVCGEGASNLFSGRGIMLVKSICDKLIYSDQGRRVNAEYSWD